MAREITKNHDIIFCNRPKSRAADIFFYGCKDIGLHPTARLVRKLRNASVRGNMVNLSEMLIATSNSVVARCILGRKLQEDDGLISSLKATFRELDPFLEEVIEDHKTGENNHSDKKDFMDFLFQLQKDGMLQMELTLNNLKAILLDMFVAGSDTTSSTGEWGMAELLRNETMMKKAQEEVRKVIGKKSIIDVNHMSKMEYLKCVSKETLRLHPPPALIYRETSEIVKLRGYDIPPKVMVLTNSWAIHRDPNLWDRPEEFVPERFEKNPIDIKGLDFHYILFGFGRRGCPSLTFGVFAVECLMANLLHWFDWKQPEELDMDEVSGFTVHKKNPLLLIPIPNSP
ncbi:phenylacetaldehyde oxime monooxygenase CYP71AN24 [Ziziphus jujuba]|uniref:Phenylacetaldehyde oxime monooxygenase CYP71AN24 n=1 Tax=Ziziphus jujuba TaxID=326968 RepID=A0ABM4A2I3_ZIZJJ|nr:phenylacetaldehyde oxime monooxygenase CYP71AN24 [Ziziphus jujuba]